MGTTFSNLLMHVVFSTKHRRTFIKPGLREQLYPYIGGIVRSNNGVLYSIGGMEDHIHMLVRWNTTRTVANLLKEMKASSSQWIHETFPDRQDFAWQTGYAAFSVSQSHCQSVTQYIENQERHHRKQTFKEELIRLLDAHEIEYDEKYLWD